MRKHLNSWLCLPLVLGAASLAGCSGDDSTAATSTNDSGTGDAGDAGVADATVDSGHSDTGADSQTSAEGAADVGVTDAGPEATLAEAATADTGSDVGVDSGVSQLVALPGYSLSVFTTGTTGGTNYKGPDSIEVDGAYLWVGYQMGVPKNDGSDGGVGTPVNSEVVQYKLADGLPTGKHFTISGHCDGVRIDPATHIVWATSNEDGDPIVESFDPSVADAGAALVHYTLTGLNHGGGLDDMAFFGNKMIVATSSPSGLGVSALAEMKVSGTTINFVEYLDTSAPAIDVTTGGDAGAPTTLNLTDPDSLSIDDKGNLVLVSQGDSKLIFVAKGTTPSAPPADGGVDAGDAGTTTPVKVYPTGTQLDDTVFATQAAGMLLVADAKQNAIYAIHGTFTPGTAFTETPDDSTIPGIVGTVDLRTGIDPATGANYASTGFVTPIALGFGKPTGLLFVKQ